MMYTVSAVVLVILTSATLALAGVDVQAPGLRVQVNTPQHPPPQVRVIERERVVVREREVVRKKNKRHRKHYKKHRHDTYYY
jgi:hypothetical protein